MILLPKWLPFGNRRVPCTTIVLHSTAGKSATSSIAWLRKIGLSYHYIIERDGSIYKCVPSSKRAFHAGKSVGPNGPNVNEYSIGISFANYEQGGEPITTAQVAAMRSLCYELKGAFPIQYITTHYAIAPGRKSDPKMLDTKHINELAADLKLIAWKIPK